MNADLILQPLALARHLAPIARQLAEQKPPRRASLATGRLAVIDLVGVLLPSPLRRFREAIHSAAADPGVRAIAVYADTPGGTVSGTIEASQAVARAAKAKEVHFMCEGHLCSAGYWIAAESTSITAAPSTIVGAVGSTITLVDDSEFWKSAGVKFVHVTSGINKPVGYPGQPALQEHVDMLRALVDADLARFEASIERGRKLTGPRLAAVTDGSVWNASVAKSKGLVDTIATPEERLAELEKAHAEQFTGFVGQAAAAKLDSLVVHPTQTRCRFADAPASVKAALRAEYPSLVAAAERHQSKVNRYPWRYDERGELNPLFR